MRGRDYARLCPPDATPWSYRNAHVFAVAGVAGFTALILLMRICTARSALYWTRGSKRELMDGATAPDYGALIAGDGVGGFPLPLLTGLLLLGLLFVCVKNYLDLSQGSRAIWLMRRLPDRWELPRRCCGLPLLGMAAALVLLLIVVLLFYLVYLWLIPEACRAPDQWHRLWLWLAPCVDAPPTTLMSHVRPDPLGPDLATIGGIPHAHL